MIKIKIAIWLINSNLTDPTIEDILNFAKINDFKEANSKKLFYKKIKQKKRWATNFRDYNKIMKNKKIKKFK